MLGFIILIVCLFVAAYFVMGKRAPETRDKIIAAVMAALGAAATWFNDIFVKWIMG